MKNKEIIVGLGISFIIIVLIALSVSDDVRYEVGFIDGYCSDKDGIQDIGYLNFNTFEEQNTINCDCSPDCVPNSISRTG